MGALLTGVFASKTISGSSASLLTQAIGAGAVLLYSLFMTALVLWLTSRLVRLRTTEAEETEGLDISLHAERMGT